MKVLVTRPAPQAQPLCQRLTESGHDCRALPLLEIEPVDLNSRAAAPLRQKLLDIDHQDHVIVVSTNAARLLLDALDHYWPQLPVGIRWWAIGSATGELLASAGLEPEINQGVMNSEALLAHPDLQDVAGQKVLIARGQGGRPLLGDTLAARGARVDYAELYRRRCPDYSAAEIKSRIYDFAPQAILISSGEALAHLLRLAPALAEDTWLVVPSPRVAEQARQAGRIRIVVAENATDDAMIAALDAARLM